MNVMFIAPTSMARLAGKGGAFFIIPQNFTYSYKHETKFKMLDNGAYEGETASFDQLIRIAEQISADEIVIPDVMNDASKTLSNAETYMPLVPKRFKTALVPQGKDVRQFLDCFFQMQRLHPDTLCFPKWLGKDRPLILSYLAHHDMLPRTFNYHLLGLDDVAELYGYPLDLRQNIRSVDTSKPFTYAFHNQFLGVWETEKLTRVPFDTPAFEGRQKTLLLSNMQRVLDVAERI